MELLALSFLTAFGKLYLLCRLMTAGRVVAYQKWFDIGFTVFVPLLFLGTFHGALFAVLSGLWFSLMLWFISRFVKPTPYTWKKQKTQ